MATHEWEYELGFGTGRATVTTDAAPPGCIDWSIPDADFSADDEILAHEIWVCFEEDVEVDPDANRGALEAAGLIEMLADQTWSLTEPGGRVCRRDS